MYSVATPYSMPVTSQKKARNIGDGLILEAIFRGLEPNRCLHSFSTRERLTEQKLDQINSTQALILAGANQLSDHFMLFPDTPLDILQKIRVPIIPFAIGINGHPEKTKKMNAETKEMLVWVHSKILYSSWRCPNTIRYLSQQVPEIAGQALMTGCPVLYGEPLLGGKPFSDHRKRIVVSITEKNQYENREKKILRFVADTFKSSEKFLSIHQDFLPKKRGLFGFVQGQRWAKNPIEDIRQYAKKMGYQIFCPKSANECQAFYQTCDVHYGSRLHAHLYFLSQAKPTYLAAIDDRAKGFSEAFDFELMDVQKIGSLGDFDFERVRKSALWHHKSLLKFTQYLNHEVFKN